MSSKFDVLIERLTAEHERQVEELQTQVKALRQQLHQNHRGSQISVNVLTEARYESSSSTRYSDGISSSMVSKMAIEESSNRMTARGRGSVSKAIFPALSLRCQDEEENLRQSFNSALTGMRTMRCSGMHSLNEFLGSSGFEFFVLFLILLNTINMCIQVQYDGFDRAYKLDIQGYKRGEDAWPSAAKVLETVERSFVVIFSVELLLRLIAFRCKFFCSAFNWLDCFIVAAGVLEWVAASAFDPKMMRILRLTRIARTIKSFKFRRFFDAMLFLATSIRASFSVLFWSLLLLTVIQCISALILCQALAGWFDAAPQSVATTEVFMYYGTFTRTMLTMFEILLANWPVPCRVLSEAVGEEFGYLVLVYKLVCGFAVLNVVSAVFLQQTMKIMSQDTSMMLLERSRIEKNYKMQLEQLFNLLDTNQNGILSVEEMESQLGMPEVRTICLKMGISVHDIEDMFNLFDLSREGLPINEFIHAAHAVRAQANSLDVARLLMHARHMVNQMVIIEEQGAHILEDIDNLTVLFHRLQGSQEKLINGVAKRENGDSSPLPPSPLDPLLICPTHLPRPQGTPSIARIPERADA